MSEPPKFETVVELGDYALVRVTYDNDKSYVYTAKITKNDKWAKSGIQEDFFKELVTKYLKREE